ncbi:hypothetical protein SDC9_122397 [bioreactor metagenome]|uniref:Uncharacterized protein n=1 Tax=bioreactor metagenome TaxID=1076179 RepID=A0A645CEQ9_9ZZZZ
MPIKAINKPIPALMAVLTDFGMALAIASLTLNAVSIMNITPSIKTAVNANCQVCPIPKTTENAKKAFNPIPGASAKGNFA